MRSAEPAGHPLLQRALCLSSPPWGSHSPALPLPRACRVCSIACCTRMASTCYGAKWNTCCRTSLRKNKTYNPDELPLRNKTLVATATTTSCLKTVRVLCSIPGSFFTCRLIFRLHPSHSGLPLPFASMLEGPRKRPWAFTSEAMQPDRTALLRSGSASGFDIHKGTATPEQHRGR